MSVCLTGLSVKLSSVLVGELPPMLDAEGCLLLGSVRTTCPASSVAREGSVRQ